MEDNDFDLGEALESSFEQVTTPRDDAGRFVSKQEDQPAESETPEVEQVAEEAEGVEDTEIETQEAEGENLEADEQVLPPDDWSEDDKAVFAAAPKEVQQWMLNKSKDLQGDYTQKTQELAEQRKAFEPMQAVVNKWGQHIQSVGVTPDHAIDVLMNADFIMRTGTPEQKVAMLEQIKRDYGIQEPSGEDEYADPEISQLKTEIASLKSQLQQNFNAQQTTQQAEAQRAIDEFKANAPYFDDVSVSMGRLMSSGEATDLQSAYEKACKLNPEVSKKIAEEEASAKREAEAKAAREKAAKALKAKTKTATAAKGNAAPPSNWMDSVSQAAEKAFG